MTSALEQLDWDNQAHGGAISALLEVDDLSRVVFREEVPPKELRQALIGLKQGQYDKLLFESGGRVEILNTHVDYRLPFEMVALSYLKKDWFSAFLKIQTINHTHYVDRENRPPIHVRNPRFWMHNGYESTDPTNEEANHLKVNFGRFLSRIELIVKADWDLATEEKTESEDKLYKIPSAIAYKLEK